MYGSSSNSNLFAASSRTGDRGIVLGAPSLRSTDVDEPVQFQNGCETTVTMRQVPLFLVTTFDFLRAAAETGYEGLFRKESSATRLRVDVLQPLFRAGRPIPSNFGVDEVATAVKRFVRQLETRLLHGAQLERRLESLSNQGDRTDVPSALMRLFAPKVPPGFLNATQHRRPDFKKWRRDESRLLPDTHIATLGYLMRRLREIAGHAARTRMDAHNLAIVFAPALFDDTTAKSHAVKEVTMRRVRIVEMLIANAPWIGLAPDFYVTLNRLPSRAQEDDSVSIQQGSACNVSQDQDATGLETPPFSPVQSDTESNFEFDNCLNQVNSHHRYRQHQEPDKENSKIITVVAAKEERGKSEVPEEKKKKTKEQGGEVRRHDDLASLFSPSTSGNAQLIAVASTPTALRIPHHSAPLSTARPSVVQTRKSGIVQRQIDHFNRLSIDGKGGQQGGN